LIYKKADNKNNGIVITATYFVGTFLLIAAGIAGAFGLIQIPAQWMIGFVGLIPIVMGIRSLLNDDDDEEEKAIATLQKIKTRWLQVLIVTISLGADDLGVYIPLFTTLSQGEVIIMLIIFALGTTGLCIVSYQLTRIDGLSLFIEKYERFIIGITFIIIGIFVMVESKTFIALSEIFQH
jgi:cadmium resistance transport/sequestration family protein